MNFRSKTPFSPQKISWKTFDEFAGLSTDFAHIDPNCFWNKGSHSYPHLSKVFDLSRNYNVLKTIKVLAPKHYTRSDFLFRLLNKHNFSRKNNIGGVHKIILKLKLSLKLPLLQNFLKRLILKSKPSTIIN